MLWIDWNSAFASDYKIQKSNDNVSWADIASVSDSQGGFVYTDFPETLARYVRILGVAGSGFDMRECEVLGSSVLQVATPALTPEASDTPEQTLSVRMTCVTPGATMRYTLDGTTPTSTHGNIYRHPLNLFVTTTVKAIAYSSELPDSSIANRTYTFSDGAGLKGEYFNNMNLDGTPVLTRADASVDFDWSSALPATNVHANGFSVRWSGLLRPLYTGKYTFKTNSNGGVRLIVNGQRLIDHFDDHAPTSNAGTIDLQADQQYPITMEYCNYVGHALATLSWSNSHQSTQIIPYQSLYSPNKKPFVVHNIPGLIEAEDYDIGEDGAAYHDTTIGNIGGAYRNDNVDVQAIADASNGYKVGWCDKGEWLEYTLANVKTGKYDVTLRYASAATPGDLCVKLGDGPNGVNFVTLGTFTDIVNQGSWSTFYTTTLHNVSISGGTEKILRLETGGNFDIDCVKFTFRR
jgi:hypothetical protein